MNMKRGLVFSLCALALAAYSGQAQAAVNLSLNLRYNDPADPTEGGAFTLVAKTDNANGIAAINAYLSNINAAGLTFSAGINQLSGGPYVTAVTGGTNVVYGQDTSSGTLVMNVGRTGGPATVATDPLKNPTWNNVSAIFNGTFGATRPAFITVGANSTDANVFNAGTTTTPLPAGGVVAAGTVTTTVRGDSVRTLGLNNPTNSGLIRGDADRDFDVDGDDLNAVLANFNGTGKTWTQGDFTDGLAGHVEGKVDGDDLNLVLASFNQSSATPPPAVGAVPDLLRWHWLVWPLSECLRLAAASSFGWNWFRRTLQ